MQEVYLFAFVIWSDRGISPKRQEFEHEEESFSLEELKVLSFNGRSRDGIALISR